MTQPPLLSFITVCYNGLDDTCELIESLARTVHSVSYEIIVVDNASRENEAALLQARYPAIKTIRSERNLGFSGGNNLGFEQAEGKYLFLINNDTYLEADGLHSLVERLESHPRIGAVSPKIRFAHPPRRIQFAGYTPLSTISLRNEPVGCGAEDTATFDTPHPTPYLHGAAMLVKREVIERVGAMPEIYFLYYEELDWCTQMTRAGYELWYEPRCTVFHKESQSTGQQSPLRTFYLTRNRLLYAWRNRQGCQRCLSIAYLMTIAATKNSLRYLLKKRPDLAAALWKGMGAFIALPRKNNIEPAKTITDL